MDRWMDGWIDGWMDGWMDGINPDNLQPAARFPLKIANTLTKIILEKRIYNTKANCFKSFQPNVNGCDYLCFFVYFQFDHDESFGVTTSKYFCTI
jgi:hypothetical protein